MKRTMITLAALLAGLGVANADTVAPENVTFEEGAVANSLTGAPGDPIEGAKIVSTKSMGNCVACHVISEMADVPFQGEIGPPLDGAGDRWTTAELRGIVANAKMTFPESLMPSFYKTSGYIRPGKAYTGKAAEEPLAPLLSGQQIEDVVAYLTTLK